MRRIYESTAVHRDDDDAFSPGEKDEKRKPQAMRTVPSTYLSRLIIPHRLRFWAITVKISTPNPEYAVGEDIPFLVTMKNAMPFPITIPVQSPVPWHWTVDGHREASHVQLRDPPDEKRGFRFDRGERKEYLRRWQGLFRVSTSEWQPAEPGEYTIGVGLNVDDAKAKGVYDETTVKIVP